MHQVEIEQAINEILAESDFFAENNPITYLVFLERYRHMLDEVQINNTNEIIHNLTERQKFIMEMNLKKINQHQMMIEEGAIEEKNEEK
jgi:zona occludens toxin (predicted ATPase)